MDKYGNTIDYVRLHSDQDSDGDDTEHDNIDNAYNDDIEHIWNMVISDNSERTTETHTAAVETEQTSNNNDETALTIKVETPLKESENKNQGN